MHEDKKRILIVEDERQFADMVKLRLELDGYACTVAGDVPSAVMEMKSSSFDLLILDLMLPGGGGLAVLEERRKRPAHRFLPVAVLTGKSITPDLRARLEAYGMSALFIKPYDPDLFLAGVRELIPKETETQQ
jgi:DNA-binding response OmpR family regulator